MAYNTVISVTELDELIKSRAVRIIDCRFNIADPEAGLNLYAKAHIPGSQYAHLDRVLSGPVEPGITGRHTLPEEGKLVDQFREWGISNEDQMVVYDHSHGGIAARLWWLFNWLGHEQVAVLDGGWAAWESAQLPTTDEVTPNKRSTFVKKETKFNTKSAAEVWGLISSGQQACIVDSRSSPRYRGLQEPLDPIAGHIPTAVNRPFLENLTDSGLWKSKSKLREEWLKILNGIESNQAIVYCGSGVTACHNLLSIKHAGLDVPILYPGSWSEWITDSERDIVTAD